MTILTYSPATIDAFLKEYQSVAYRHLSLEYVRLSSPVAVPTFGAPCDKALYEVRASFLHDPETVYIIGMFEKRVLEELAFVADADNWKQRTIVNIITDRYGIVTSRKFRY